VDAAMMFALVMSVTPRRFKSSGISDAADSVKRQMSTLDADANAVVLNK
jgi:hypothetical protein